MNSTPVQVPDRRSLWYGHPGADESQRSHDEIRIIKDMANEDVEWFLQSNAIDPAAAKELRNEPPHVALAVVERGPLRACVNPSGALVARIRDAKRGTLGSAGRYGGMPPPAALNPTTSELDRFLAENRIDQAGVASIRSESFDVQKAVMARGPLINTTNPSASLMARIRTVKMEAAQGAVAGTYGMGVVPALSSGADAQPRALQDDKDSWNNSYDREMVNDEARKAIDKLNQGGAAPAESPRRSRSPRREWANDGAAGGDNGGSAISNIENTDDKQLQDEALKAIQALNATSEQGY